MSRLLWVKLNTCLPSRSFCLAVFHSFGFPPEGAGAFWAEIGMPARMIEATKESNNLVVFFMGVLLGTLSAMGRVYTNGQGEERNAGGGMGARHGGEGREATDAPCSAQSQRRRSPSYARI